VKRFEVFSTILKCFEVIVPQNVPFGIFAIKLTSCGFVVFQS